MTKTITQTKATVAIYDIKKKEVSEKVFTFAGSGDAEITLKRKINPLLDKNEKYVALVDTETVQTTYQMDLETFIKYASEVAEAEAEAE